jgi:hypothetical protein
VVEFHPSDNSIHGFDVDDVWARHPAVQDNRARGQRRIESARVALLDAHEQIWLPNFVPGAPLIDMKSMSIKLLTVDLDFR